MIQVPYKLLSLIYTAMLTLKSLDENITANVWGGTRPEDAEKNWKAILYIIDRIESLLERYTPEGGNH